MLKEGNRKIFINAMAMMNPKAKKSIKRTNQNSKDGPYPWLACWNEYQTKKGAKDAKGGKPGLTPPCGVAPPALLLHSLRGEESRGFQPGETRSRRTCRTSSIAGSRKATPRVEGFNFEVIISYSGIGCSFNTMHEFAD